MVGDVGAPHRQVEPVALLKPPRYIEQEHRDLFLGGPAPEQQHMVARAPKAGDHRRHELVGECRLVVRQAAKAGAPEHGDGRVLDRFRGKTIVACALETENVALQME